MTKRTTVSAWMIQSKQTLIYPDQVYILPGGSAWQRSGRRAGCRLSRAIDQQPVGKSGGIGTWSKSGKWSWVALMG